MKDRSEVESKINVLITKVTALNIQKTWKVLLPQNHGQQSLASSRFASIHGKLTTTEQWMNAAEACRILPSFHHPH